MELSETSIFYIVALIMLVDYIWIMCRLRRQYKLYADCTQVPSEMMGCLSQEKFAKTREFAIHKCKYKIVRETYIYIICVISLFNGWLPRIWYLTNDLFKRRGYEPDSIAQSAVYLFTLNTLHMLLQLPPAIYYNFVVVHTHGFDNLAFLFYFVSKFKRHIVQHVVLLPTFCGVIYILKIDGIISFVYTCLILMVVSFIYRMIHPNYVAPVVNSFVPLSESDMKNEIEKLAASLGFPLSHLCINKEFPQYRYCDAYVYGLIKEKIILYDTLLADFLPPKNGSENNKETGDKREEGGEGREANRNDNENEQQQEKQNVTMNKEKKGLEIFEILAVVAHELGHKKLNHSFQIFILTEINAFLLCCIFVFLFPYQTFYRAFGFQEEPAVIGLTLIMQYICMPYFEVVTFVYGVVTQQFEIQADGFVKSLGKAHFLKRALIKMNMKNLKLPIFEPLYSSWHRSYPPMIDRIRALNKDE